MEDFELKREQICQLEMKKPGRIRLGHFVTHPDGGKLVEITLRHRVAYDRLVQLTQAFSPEIVRS
jgi:hypothetical protein